MPDYSFIAEPKVPQGLQTLGSLVNTAQGMQNLQRGGVALERERATLQPQIAQQRAQTGLAQTQEKSGAFKLAGEQSAAAMQIGAGLLQDPRIAQSDPEGTIEAANEAYGQMVAAGIPKATADFWASQIKAKAHQPGAAVQLLRNVTRAAAGPAAQAGVINAPLSQVSTQAGTNFLQTQPGAENAVPAGSMLPTGVAPTQAEQPEKDALGRPIIQKRDQRGGITYAPPPNSDYKPLMTLPPGETPQTAAPLLALRDNAQAAAAAVPSQRFNNRQILDLADSAFTGTGSEQFAKVLNAVGLQRTNDTGADTSKLQHFIGLQIQQNAASMGANTDAARELAAQAVLPGSSPAKAIKAITKINDAYATGVELFNRGIDATLKSPSNTKDIFAIRDFQNAWTANFDPRIVMLQNAQSAGDKGETAAVLKAMRPEERKQLLVKARMLQTLIQRGAVGGP